MKVKGRELQQFMNEAWPSEDWFWDHDLFEDPDPDETYDTDDIGPLMYQGRDDVRRTELDLAVLIRKWRKERDFDVFTVTVPKDKSLEFELLIKSAGYKLG